MHCILSIQKSKLDCLIVLIFHLPSIITIFLHLITITNHLKAKNHLETVSFFKKFPLKLLFCFECVSVSDRQMIHLMQVANDLLLSVVIIIVSTS